MTLTVEQLREALEYDPRTGVFLWRRSISGPRKAGDEAGSLNARGRRYIGVNGKLYCAHRLAWFYAHGVWPACDIDHENGNPDDNRLANLRLATRSQNNANSKVRRDNASGFKGVQKRRNKWLAYLTANGKQVYLGYHSTPEAAHAAYVAEAARRHGEFARAA